MTKSAKRLSGTGLHGQASGGRRAPSPVDARSVSTRKARWLTISLLEDRRLPRLGFPFARSKVIGLAKCHSFFFCVFVLTQLALRYTLVPFHSLHPLA
jgi:hypothetical protein